MILASYEECQSLTAPVICVSRKSSNHRDLWVGQTHRIVIEV